MQLAFELIERPDSDCMYKYRVHIQDVWANPSVDRFIDFILRDEREWGNVFLVNEPEHYSFSRKIVEYSHGEIFNSNDALLDKLDGKPIEACYAMGGWSRMDYYVCVKGV